MTGTCSHCGNDRGLYGQVRNGRFLCGACLGFTDEELAELMAICRAELESMRGQQLELFP
jgi:hypothetical protein